LQLLLSNDDGVYAPGIAALNHVLSSFADTIVFAPDRNRSGASNSLTLSAPLRVKTLSNGFFSVEGTPTDCVHLALTGLLDTLPNMVVSGINDGGNLGDDVWYSGTVAAAMEGRFLGLPAIAISLDGAKHFESAAKVAGQLVRQLSEHPLSEHTILNVNVPDVPYEELQGYEITRLGSRHLAEPTVKITDRRGNKRFWIVMRGAEQDAGEGTDFHALTQKRVSITPLQIDITHHAMIKPLQQWVNALD